jgi:hypothetical protein
MLYKAGYSRTMTDDQQDTIGNATAIIERFGGIRPMANKMNIPVTTVQGWKQRNAIPASRRDDIIKAAVQNRLDLGDLLIGITSEGVATGIDAAAERITHRRKEVFETVVPRSDTMKPLFYGGLLLMAGAIIGGVFAIAPHVRNIASNDDAQRVAELQAEVERLRQEQAKKQQATVMPAMLSDLQNKVKDLSEQAKGYSTVINDLKSGSVEQRIVKLEGHLHQMLPQTRALGLSGMLQKVQGMQQTPQGMNALSGILNDIVAQLEAQGGVSAKPGSITPALQKLRENDPELAQTVEGVAPEDMKAAAMLLGMAQLRDSLMRDNDSFDTDLNILKMTVAKDNTQLLEAIDRLAPQAKKGVLTPTGLSKEFRGLAGEVVAASLTGEDVALQDKLKARLNDVMIVEKNGEQISGTPTQKTINEAQKKLDQGDVPGALALLQTLEGPAADKAAPFIDQAQATVAAQELQKMLGINVLEQLKNSPTLRDPSNMTSGSMKSLLMQVQGMIPGYGYSTDKETGFSIYVPPPITLPVTP